MNGAALAEKIYAGYARAGAQAGFAYDVYRPADGGNPLAAGNCALADLSCVIVHGQGDRAPVHYGESTWWSYHDARLTAVGDYLVGHMGVFFVAAQQDFLPVLLVQCDRTLSLLRPTQPSGVGAVGYGGEVGANDALLLSMWPASVLQGTKGEANAAGLPLDVKTPSFRILLPALPTVAIRTGDVLLDDLGRRYAVHSAELSALGWRVLAMQMGA